MLDHDGATTTNIWGSLRQLFQSNNDARENDLHTEIRNLIQGDAPVNLFYQHVKAIGDELRELGDPVSDTHLINTIVVGLSEDFDKHASFIPMMRPPPTFAEVCSMLQLAADTQAHKDSRPRVFHVAARPPMPSPSVPPLPAPATMPPLMPSVQPPPGWHPSPNYRGKNPIYRPALDALGASFDTVAFKPCAGSEYSTCGSILASSA